MLSYFHDNDMVTEKFIICLVLHTFMHIMVTENRIYVYPMVTGNWIYVYPIGNGEMVPHAFSYV
jgi:hypothetical protein